MKANAASRTAQYMALFRAIETARPPRKRLFYDPFATSFLDEGLKLATKISSLPLIGRLVPKIIHFKSPGALSSGIARTKYIDDLLQRTIKDGVKQVIILGAGFDTRALRLHFLKDISVIEIDHPDTSQFKLDKLKKILGSLPRNVSYYQIDFNKQSLEDLAVTNNLSFNTPTTIIWEGVTNYLTPIAVEKTLSFIRRFPRGSYLVFTYIDELVLDSPQSFEGTDKLFKRLKESDEQWTFGFKPDKLSDYLVEFGLALIEDDSAREYRDKYMPERRGLLRGYEFYRVAFAKRTDE
ncbi:MAG: SAM-dependent methyltransferase [Thermodesulfobacteriota bacterium]|jgi:methyltransferase (TIGR00027 family)